MGSNKRVTLAPEIESRFEAGVRFTGAFHVAQSDVHRAVVELARRLEDLGVPYAIVGALALNAYGYRRATIDVDVLLTPQGLDRFKAACVGRGYVEKFPGSRGVRDTAHGVDIDVVLTGDYPGDGRPKPVCFPDPAEAGLEGEAFALVSLDTLIELKIASGMSAPHRLRDLADVIELVRANALPASFGDQLDAFVRSKYAELWQAAQASDVDR